MSATRGGILEPKLKHHLSGSVHVVEYMASIQPGTQFRYRVSRYADLVHEAVHDAPRFEYKATRDGSYTVEVHVIRENRVNEKHRVAFAMFDSVTPEFDVFVSAPLVAENLAVPYVPSRYPYSDFVVVQGSRFVSPAARRELKLDSSIVGETSTELLAPAGALQRYGSDLAIYSGVAVHEGKLIYGAEDVPLSSVPEELEGRVGCFSLVVESSGNLQITTDYFGLSATYLYQDDQVIIASNRFHALLIVMRDLGIELRPRAEYVVQALGSNSSWNNYPIGTEMLFEGIRIVGVHQSLCIEDGRISFKRSALARDLGSSGSLTSAEYEKLVGDACHEIRGNVRACLESDRFDEYSMDLTGGIDSRIMFAAATEIAGAPSALKIYSSPNATSDFGIALGLAEDFGFDFDYERLASRGLGRGTSPYLSPESILGYRASLSMGRSLDPVILWGDFGASNRKMILSGGCGEIVSRPNVFIGMFEGEFGDLNGTDSVEEVIGDRVRWFLSGGSIAGQAPNDLLVERFLSTFREMEIGETIFNRLELMYLSSRNRYHFTLSRDGGYGNPTFSPNMSVASFRALQATMVRSEKFEHAFRLLNGLNSSVATTEYHSPKYNRALSRWMMRQSDSGGSGSAPTVRSSTASRTRFESEFRRVVSSKRERSASVPRARSLSQELVGDEVQYMRARSLELLRMLVDMELPHVRETIGIPLFFFLSYYSEENDSGYTRQRIRILYRKLTNIVSQLELAR